MVHLGIGVMIQMLRGNKETIDALALAKGKMIHALVLSVEHHKDGELILTFDDCALALRDEGRSCCESRYMLTDDDLSSFVGAVFIDADLRDGPNVEDEEYGDHEQQFLLVNTSLGTLTVVTHNEHNGYYGGFSISALIRPLE